MYRPPRFSLGDINIFLNKFSDIITSTNSNDYNLIYDINFHYATDVHSLFINVIDLFSCIQQITFPLHQYIGHIIDLVVTSISNMLSKLPISLPPITYYDVISIEIDVPSKYNVKIRIVHKDIISIDFEFSSDNNKTNL